MCADRVAREVPGPGQESVWDYPRPPRLEQMSERVVVEHGGRVIVDTRAAWRVLETSHPPTYYLPANAFVDGVLQPAAGGSYCEFKGVAAYVDVVVGDDVVPGVGWTYPDPTPAYAALRGAVALYPGRLDRVTVDGEVVRAQEGDFYGGWITDRVVGPFKGAPGTRGW